MGANLCWPTGSADLPAASPEQVSLDRYREAVTPIRILLLVGASVVIGLFAGATASGKWREYLLWRNGVDFGTRTPTSRDIGFYVFDLPWLRYLVDFAIGHASSAARRGGRALPLRGSGCSRQQDRSPAPPPRSSRC